LAASPFGVPGALAALALRKDYAADACRKERDLEIDQEAEREAGAAEVRQQLRHVKTKDLRHRLEFHDELTADDEIEPGVTDHRLFVEDLPWDLTLEGDASKGELDAHGFLVDGLEKPGSQAAVDFDGGTDGRVSELIEFGPGLGKDEWFHNPSSADEVSWFRPWDFGSRGVNHA
jgi:hypothetical protein